MKDRLKFRGKFADDYICMKKGEWYITSESQPIADFFEFVSKDIIDPATVGQWTGLKDKNGVDIYEGDKLFVVVFDGNEKGAVECNDCGFGFSYSVRSDNDGLLRGIPSCAKIIGTIHDEVKL